jgi:chemotaxis protein CheY-P-specific phosphatase CheC
MFKKLDVIQKDALNAMANVGTRNAFRALSESTNSKIRLSVSELDTLSLEQLSKMFEVSQKLIVAVLTSKGWEASDNAPACAMLIFPQETTSSLASVLQKGKIDATRELSSTTLNALRLISQSIIRCYLVATTKFLNVEVQPRELRLVAILGETITDFVHSMLFGMNEKPEHVLMLKTEFSVAPNVKREYYFLLNKNILSFPPTELDPVYFTRL